MITSELENQSLEELLTLWKSGEYEFSKYYRLIRSIMKRYDENDPELEIFLIEWRILMCDVNDHRNKRFIARNEGQNLSELFPANWKQKIIEIAKNEKNTLVKAKYFDLVWFVYRDSDILKMATASYNDCIKVAQQKKLSSQVYDSVDRLFSLYAETKKNEELKVNYRLAVDLTESLFQEQETYYGRKIIESIMHFSKWLNDVIDFKLIIKLCEKGHQSLVKKNQSYFMEERELLKLKAACEKAAGESPRNSILNIGFSFIGEADWVLEQRKTHMVASIFLTEALQHFVNVGASKILIEDLKKRIVASNKIMYEQEMFTATDHKTFDFGDFSDWIEQLEDQQTAEEVIKALTVTHYLIPDYNESIEYIKSKPKDWTDEVRHLQFDKGKKRFDTANEDSKFENDVKNDFGRTILVYMKHNVNEFFNVLESKGNLEEELYSIFNNSSLIDSNQLELLQLAVSHYKRREFPASIHIIMFQLEGLLRNLVRNIGGVDISVKTGGVMNTRLLADLISELEKVDYRFYKFLSQFLTEEGINYRNKMGHSEFKISNMERCLNRYLIIVVLMIISTKSRTSERKNSLEPA